jgi:RimJ/RimL family protein N-acetyltransferase
MAKVKAKAAVGKKKPAKSGKAAMASPRQRKAAPASTRAKQKAAAPARRPAAKKPASTAQSRRTPVRKAAAPARSAGKGKSAAARKTVARKPAPSAKKAVARKAAPPARKVSVTKKALPSRKVAAKPVAKAKTKVPAPKAKAKPPVKAVKVAAKKPVPVKKPAPVAKPVAKVLPAARRPLPKTAAPKTLPNVPTLPVETAKVLPLKKPEVPAGKPKAVPAVKTARLRPARPSRPVARPVTPSAPAVVHPDGVPATPLRRPQIETPSAIAMSLAAATARLSARRIRDLLPVRIQTRRLVLRAPIRGDVPELVKLADNPNIADKLSRLPSPYTRADGIGFVEITSQRPDERPYAMTLEGVFIGVVGISFPANQPPEFGYWLGEPHWGQGYMNEAVRAVLDAAHQTREFPVIRARALADNAVSLHILEKAGFKRVDKYKATEGKFKDKLLFVMELEQPRWT